jgi:hypothetical protein
VWDDKLHDEMKLDPPVSGTAPFNGEMTSRGRQSEHVNRDFITAPLFYCTEALYELRRVPTSGEAASQVKTSLHQGLISLRLTTYSFVAKLIKTVTRDKSKMKEDDKSLVFLILCPEIRKSESVEAKKCVNAVSRPIDLMNYTFFPA